MKDGLISERGTHDDLVKAERDYFQMLQFDQVRDRKNSESGDLVIAEETKTSEEGKCYVKT